MKDQQNHIITEQMVGSLENARDGPDLYDNWAQNSDVKEWMLKLLLRIMVLLGVKREVSAAVQAATGAQEEGGAAEGGGSGEHGDESESGQTDGTIESDWRILENGGSITLRMAGDGDDDEEGESRSKKSGDS